MDSSNNNPPYEQSRSEDDVAAEKSARKLDLEKHKHIIFILFMYFLSVLFAVGLIILFIQYFVPNELNFWQLSKNQLTTLQNFTFSGALTYIWTTFRKNL